MALITLTYLFFIAINTTPIYERNFTVDYNSGTFLKDGRPFKYISGSIHFFRIVPEHWNRAFLLAKAAGFNAIETYICWNVHEPKKYSYRFDGRFDVISFIKLAQEHELLVILRPPPYCDAELDFGGLPAWLLDDKVAVRSIDPNYLKEVDRWYSTVIPMIKPHLYINGGPIIMIQIENEYGSYGSDKNYLSTLKIMIDKYLEHSHVVYFTTDGCNEEFVSKGYLNDTLVTIDFGPGTPPSSCINILKQFLPNGPFVNSEFYSGWFTSWGSQRTTTSIKALNDTFHAILENKMNVNFYMFYGGTNWEYLAGSLEYYNTKTKSFAPVITSYDYDGPLTEAGDITDKFLIIRNTVYDLFKHDLPPIPEPTQKYTHQNITHKTIYSLFDNYKQLIDGVTSLSIDQSKSFEEIGIYYGFCLFLTTLPTQQYDVNITLKNVADFAVVYDMNKKQQITRLYRTNESTILFKRDFSDAKIAFLVENLGRIAYSNLHDLKGLGKMTIDPNTSLTWTNIPINLTKIFNGRLMATNDTSSAAFYEFRFNITYQQKLNTYLKPSKCFSRGFIFVNRHNVGRFNVEQGPQLTNYVPDSYLRIGANSVVIFSTVGLLCDQLYFDFVDSQQYT